MVGMGSRDEDGVGDDHYTCVSPPMYWWGWAIWEKEGGRGIPIQLCPLTDGLGQPAAGTATAWAALPGLEVNITGIATRSDGG